MSQPVTTNPLIIMLINMTVVFLVLMALGVVINLIHMIDPTKPKTAPKEEVVEEAPAVEAPAAEPVTAPVEEGISPEVVAVIAAAVASMGYGAGSVRAIRPLERNNWKNSGRNVIQGRG